MKNSQINLNTEIRIWSPASRERRVWGNCLSYSIKLYGDGRITHAGETVYAKKAPANKKEIQIKINRFLQKAEEINFSAIYEENSAKVLPFVHDGITTSTGVWLNGRYREVSCSSGFCNQEIRELHKYFVVLFADDMSRKN